MRLFFVCLLLVTLWVAPASATYMGCQSDCGNEEGCCCYVPCTEYKEESFTADQCELVPELKYCRKKRYKLKYYKQKFIKYVPKVFEQTVARYEPEYYYEAYCEYHKHAKKVRCCQSVPYTVYKKVTLPPEECEPSCCQ